MLDEYCYLCVRFISDMVLFRSPCLLWLSKRLYYVSVQWFGSLEARLVQALCEFVVVPVFQWVCEKCVCGYAVQYFIGISMNKYLSYVVKGFHIFVFPCFS